MAMLPDLEWNEVRRLEVVRVCAYMQNEDWCFLEFCPDDIRWHPCQSTPERIARAEAEMQKILQTA